MMLALQPEGWTLIPAVSIFVAMCFGALYWEHED